MSDLIDRAQAQTELQFAARRYTVAHEANGEGKVVWSDNLISVTDAIDALRKVPSAQLGTDCISRQAAIDGIEKRQMNIMRSTVLLDRMSFDGLADALDIIKLLPTAHPEPCEDAVNRETLLKFFDGWMSALDENCHNQSVSDLKIIKRDFANLPPVMPKQRTGKWIRLDMHAHLADHKCTACGQECYVPTCMGEPLYAFCPNCGADMRTAAQIVHDAIDNTPMAEDAFPGIKERLHKAVDDMREVAK